MLFIDKEPKESDLNLQKYKPKRWVFAGKVKNIANNIDVDGIFVSATNLTILWFRC